jgi:hypothetical protein
MNETVSPAEQVTRVAMLLGRAVLRWKRENEKSSELSEFDSDSLPERLEFSPDSSLSVTGQNDEAIRSKAKTTGSALERKSSQISMPTSLENQTNKSEVWESSDLSTNIRIVFGRVFRQSFFILTAEPSTRKVIANWLSCY